MVWNSYIGPVHHDVISAMPWLIQWNMYIQPQQGAVEVSAPGAEEKVQGFMLPIALTM